ncbi:MAG: YcxB family protein [Lachnospira sp.]
MAEKIEFDTQVNARDLFDFKVYHYYHSSGGIFGTLFGIIAVVICVISVGRTNISYTLMMGLFAVMFTVYPPISMLLKSRQQVKKGIFDKPVHYSVTKEGITLSQEELSENVGWDEIYKIKFTGKSLILYISALRANVLPLRNLGDKAKDFVSLAKQELQPFQVKVKESKLK